ncbi:unnamed protein product [Rhizophagus irregularis]|nr:unnamed protein product [Rhizophagus irregularis]
MSINFYKEIIDNYKNLYETKEGYDTKIYAGEKQNIKEFHVHSFILKTQSKFFKSAFTEEIQKKDGYFILNLNYSPKIFEILLSYMYSGSIDITKLQPFDIINLLLPLDELGLQPLITYIQKILIENYFDLTANNVIETLELTYQKKSFDKLWDFNIQRICYNPDLLFKSTKFLTINPSILEIFLKRDDFCIDDEIIIWENLFKWACGQNPVTHQDINKWNKNDFTVMGRRLNSNLQTAKASYPIDENQIYSIWCNPCCGPTFGSGNDLLCSNGNWSSNQFTYHKIHFPSNFNINDYEVFQIKK